MLVVEGSFARARVDSVVCQRRAHHREVADIDEHRALTEVRLDGDVDPVVQHPERAHEVRDRTIAIAREAFGVEHDVVDIEGASGEGAETTEEAGVSLGRCRAEQARGHDRTGVHHRVERPAARLVHGDRVERVTGGLDSHPGEKRVDSEIVERQAEGKGLGDRLDRERRVRVARCVTVPVDGDDRQAEQGGIGVGERRDVGRQLAVADVAQALVEVLQLE